MLVLSVVRSMGLFLQSGDKRMLLLFTYCDCVYFVLDSYSLRKITVAFNACVYRSRLVQCSLLRCFGLNFGMLFADLHGIPIGMLYVFLLVTGSRPLYLFESLVFSCSGLSGFGILFLFLTHKVFFVTSGF
jgi:hypothetical protein